MARQAFFAKLEALFERFFKWIGFATGAIALIGGAVSAVNRWYDLRFLSFLHNHARDFWLFSISALVLSLWIWTWSLNRRFTQGFTDNFKGNLDSNWDNVKPWRITDDGHLLVTGSDAGGLTKVGTHWENYTLEFECKILKECLGVVVRAMNLGNYYMFQIRRDCLRPHRRVTVPIVMDEKLKTEDQEASQIALPGNLVSYALGWEIPDERRIKFEESISGWFGVRVTVRGESVSIWIKGHEVFHADSFVKIPAGKIGFRNTEYEEALVKNVRVVLHS